MADLTNLNLLADVATCLALPAHDPSKLRVARSIMRSVITPTQELQFILRCLERPPSRLGAIEHLRYKIREFELAKAGNPALRHHRLLLVHTVSKECVYVASCRDAARQGAPCQPIVLMTLAGLFSVVCVMVKESIRPM